MVSTCAYLTFELSNVIATVVSKTAAKKLMLGQHWEIPHLGLAAAQINV